MTNVFVGLDPDHSRDCIHVKINIRCNNVGKSGPVCPDGGEPGGTYLKDIGMPRTLGEQQIAKSFTMDRWLSDFSMVELGGLIKSPGYLEGITARFEYEADERHKMLHDLHATMEFVVAGEPLETPIIWAGYKEFKTFDQARASLIQNHIQPYRMNQQGTTLMCDPTPYMEDNFPKQYRREFGVMTEYDGRGRIGKPPREVRHAPEEVRFLGDDPPSKPKTYIPEPTQEDIYEDWGNFG